MPAYDHKAKLRNIKTANRYMFAKTASMFEYQGLPETIPAFELEKLIQQNGYAFIAEVNGEIYALSGSIGGEQDVYGNPTTITVANTALNLTKTYNLKTDGVLITNDDYRIGLEPLFTKGNTFLCENDINMMLWGYNSRTQKLISASDDNTRQSAEQYVKRIVDGEISVVGENAMFEGVKVQGAQSAGVPVSQMIELHQYIKGSMYNEIGISSAFNMKKERLISSEIDQAEDSLFPLVYNMMQCRIDGVKRMNEKFGLSVDVDFGSVWHYKNKRLVDGVVEKEPENEARAERPVDNVVDKSGVHGDSGRGEESQEVERERERERGQGQGSDSNPDLDQLLEVVNDENASEEDRQAAQELIDEMKQE